MHVVRDIMLVEEYDMLFPEEDKFYYGVSVIQKRISVVCPSTSANQNLRRCTADAPAYSLYCLSWTTRQIGDAPWKFQI